MTKGAGNSFFGKKMGNYIYKNDEGPNRDISCNMVISITKTKAGICWMKMDKLDLHGFSNIV